MPLVVTYPDPAADLTSLQEALQRLSRVPSQKRSLKTATAIVRAVVDLVEIQGRYETFTTAEVADLAGVSIGTVYRYARDRVDLLNALYPHRTLVLTPKDPA